MELDPFALISAVFILVLAAFVGYEVVSKVPTMLHAARRAAPTRCTA